MSSASGRISAGDINKIAGAVLVTLLAGTVIGHIAELVMPSGEEVGARAPAPAGRTAAAPQQAAAPARPAAPAAAPAAPAAGPAAPAPAAPAPQQAAAPAAAGDLKALLAAADKAAGQRLTTVRCVACHSWDEAGANKVGPALWNVVNRTKGSAAGFEYSDGMKAKGGTWTYADLDAFLTNPKEFVAGTKMTFAGLANAADRAAIIGFLRGQASSPAPLP